MNKILKKLIIVSLIIGGSIFPVSFAFIKTMNWINYELEPKYDSEGKMICQDGRNTKTSFGKRNEFTIFRCSSNGKVSWFFYNRDKNKDIDKIRYFTRSSSSPCVYTLGEKGYTKLNYETGEIIQSKNINDFSKEDQEIFNSLEKK